MSKERKLLLWGLLIGILYTVLSFILSSFVDTSNITNQVGNEKLLLVLDIISYVLYGLGIIYYLVLIIFKKIDLNKHAGGLLFWSIILLLSNFITGIFGLIVYGKLDKPKKRELPVIEYKEFTNKYICLIAFIICMIIMFIISDHVSGLVGAIIIYLSIFILMIGVFFKQLVHDFKIFKEYFKEYMSLTVKTWLKALVVMMTVGIIIQLLTGQNQSNNQETLQTMFNSLPILTGILAIIYAPFAEELMFRGVIRKFVKSKYLFIMVSGVLFGLLHVVDDSKTLAEFSFVIVYSVLGMYLASLYYKTNNLFTNITFHFLQNTLGVLGMILLYFLG